MRTATRVCAVVLLAGVSLIGCGGERTMVTRETVQSFPAPVVVQKRTVYEAIPAPPIVEERTTTIETD